MTTTSGAEQPNGIPAASRLAAHWSFPAVGRQDVIHVDDLSGNDNCLKVSEAASFEPLTASLTALSLHRAGLRAAAPPSPSLSVGARNRNFTVCAFICVREQPNGLWRSIVHKGRTDQERTLSMWLRFDSNRVHARISTDYYWNEGIEASAAELEINRWTHLAYVKNDTKLMLYLDGELDSIAVLRGESVTNPGPLYIANSPWYTTFVGAIADMRVYPTALSETHLRYLADSVSSQNPRKGT